MAHSFTFIMALAPKIPSYVGYYSGLKVISRPPSVSRVVTPPLPGLSG